MSKLTSAIHVAKAHLGMDDDTYRAFLQSVTGKQSCAKMDNQELWRVMEALKKLGFTKTNANKGSPLPADPQSKKIRALWIAMADAGIVRNRSEAALEQYVKRITGQNLKGCTVKQCQTVIETLKKWIDRIDNALLQEQLLSILAGDLSSPSVMGGLVVAEAPCERFQ